MPARRCSTCGISYPANNLYILCEVCRHATQILTNVEPDEDWRADVARAKAPVPEKDDNTYWWRVQEMYKAGLEYEYALLLAGHRNVDLHEAIELIKKAGGTLAYEILT